MVWIGNTEYDNVQLGCWIMLASMIVLVATVGLWAPYALPHIPAEEPINESCYVSKSSFLIRIEMIDGCEEEIKKMYDYGFTNIVYGTDHVSGEDLLMFKEK